MKESGSKKHKLLGTWSCLLGIVAMLLIGVGSMKEIPYAPRQVNRWLTRDVVYPVVMVPTIVALVCGVVSVFMIRGRWRSRVLTLGGYGCMMAVVCVVALAWLAWGLRNWRV